MEATGFEQTSNLATVLALLAVLACFAFLQSGSWSVRRLASVKDMLLMYDQLRHIPTVGGPSSPLISYLGSIRLYSDASKMLREGYKTVRLMIFSWTSLIKIQFRGRAFKVALFDRWLGRSLNASMQMWSDRLNSGPHGSTYHTRNGILARQPYVSHRCF
jgi:hypothetical protein